MPTLPAEQEFGWHVLLDLDDRDDPWALVGGQMTLLHCLENGITGSRPTDDGDIVLDVWTRRDAVRTTGQWLQTTHNFELTETLDGFAYRYTRGGTAIDLLIPEGLERQRQPPVALGSRPALPIDGGNQALLRVERTPVQVGSRSGHVRRPNLLGALVVKAAAFVVDSRDPERHAEDIALLAHAALDSGSLREMHTQVRPRDRKRLRDALARLPATHACWRSRPEPLAVHEAITRLSEPR
jgi:hypothetical protein